MVAPWPQTLAEENGCAVFIDRRVAEWFADFSAAEQHAVRAEVSLWSLWLLNSMQESDISPLDVADFLRATERPE